jgi:hypothetical protein
VLTRPLVSISWVPRSIRNYEGAKGSSRAACLTNNTPAGVQIPPDEDILRFDPTNVNDMPLMAVVKVSDDDNSDIKIRTFVLLDQKDGVCTPYNVHQKDVSYLAAYRDNTTDRQSRGGKWNTLVKKHSVRTTNRPKTER